VIGSYIYYLSKTLATAHIRYTAGISRLNNEIKRRKIANYRKISSRDNR